MSKLCIVLLAVAGIASAQGIDLGALAGAGGFTASGPTLAAGQVGVEACVFCTGRFGLFSEYSHWFTSGDSKGYNLSDVVRRAGGMNTCRRARAEHWAASSWAVVCGSLSAGAGTSAHKSERTDSLRIR